MTPMTSSKGNMPATTSNNMTPQKVITIDGPAASGKTSVSRELSKKLAWPWVSTGSFYRGLAFVVQELGMEGRGEEEIARLVTSKEWTVKMAETQTKVFFRDRDVTQLIGAEKVGSAASQISQLPAVRKALLPLQQSCAGPQGLIAEGRDCGTVVFPRAFLKVYLTARSQDRAQRRASEQGQSVESIQKDQIQRDARDAGRTVAPMQMANDAKILDTSDMDIQKVVSTIEMWVRDSLKEQGIS